MCWQCDHPETTREDVLEHVRAQIPDGGWTVQPVGGTRLYAPFSYTLGLTVLGLPELVVTGVKADRAAELLHVVAGYTLHTSLILPGETMSTGPWLLKAVHVTHPDAHLFTAVALYGPSVRALQLVWADDRGRWPWQSGHRAGRGGQPVLGARSPWYCDEHALPVPVSGA